MLQILVIEYDFSNKCYNSTDMKILIVQYISGCILMIKIKHLRKLFFILLGQIGFDALIDSYVLSMYNEYTFKIIYFRKKVPMTFIGIFFDLIKLTAIGRLLYFFKSKNKSIHLLLFLDECGSIRLKIAFK